MRLALTICLPVLLAACGNEDPAAPIAPQTGGKTVLTTFYPTQYFAERIAGGLLEVGCPVPDDADPIFWSPGDGDILKFQAADLIIINGAEFEKWIATASLPEGRIVDTAKSFEQEFIPFKGGVAHKHGDGGKHAHEGIDGHTWLDPNLAKIQAAAIRQAFAKRWPEHATAFEENFAALGADLDTLDAAFKEIDADQPLLASHPAYNYIAHRYGWKISNLDLDPDVRPPEDAIPTDHPAKIMLWESDPRGETAALLETKGIKSIVFSPAEMRGEQDYLATMRANIARLKAALEE